MKTIFSLFLIIGLFASVSFAADDTSSAQSDSTPKVTPVQGAAQIECPNPAKPVAKKCILRTANGPKTFILCVQDATASCPR